MIPGGELLRGGIGKEGGAEKPGGDCCGAESGKTREEKGLFLCVVVVVVVGGGVTRAGRPG